MTKRTAEQTLRDELDRANREYSKATDDYERLRGRLDEAKTALDSGFALMQSARAKVLRVEAALEALTDAPSAMKTLQEESGAMTSVEQDAAFWSGGDGPVAVDRESAIAEAARVPVQAVREAAGIPAAYTNVTAEDYVATETPKPAKAKS